MLEIYEMPGHLIRRLNQVSVSLFLQETTKAGIDITPVQYAAMTSINTDPGLDQITLASNIAYDRVTIGGVVDRLVKKGFVIRKVNSKDRRSKSLHLTGKGEALLVQIKPFISQVQLNLLDGLSDSEVDIFLSLLKKATNASNLQSRAPLKI
ncbi:MAG: transcriptional regulator [Hyphomicrobiales bacterium]|nr:MAG: transcriptional regulator [Hyphomicrobiales bacterium]